MRVRIQRLRTSPALYWDGTTWINTSTYLDANQTNDGQNWTLSNVELNVPATYRIRLFAHDNAGNIAKPQDNAKADFIVE